MPPTRRVAIFAHYDVDGLIDSHVLYYLRGLTAVADRLLFVSASGLKPGEADKLDGTAELVFAGRHDEYDFGSWNRGFAYLGDTIHDWDEVILANDSCFAPVFPLADVFAHMDSVDCDVWGNSAWATKRDFDHLNSYFLVFRRPVLEDARFRAFWAGLSTTFAQKGRDFACAAEVELSRRLLEWGYRVTSYVPESRHYLPIQGYYVRRIVPECRTPWLKVKLFTENTSDAVRVGAMLPFIDEHYPRHLIDNYIARRLGTADPPHYHYLLGSFFWPSPDARIFQLVGKVRQRRQRWWKVNLHIFSIHFPLILLPLPHRNQNSTVFSSTSGGRSRSTAF